MGCGVILICLATHAIVRVGINWGLPRGCRRVRHAVFGSTSLVPSSRKNDSCGAGNVYTSIKCQSSLCRTLTVTETPEAEFLIELWDKKICPMCGNTIPEGTRVGSGKKSEGGFCSIACFAHYHAEDLIKRAKRVAAIAERHRRS